MCWIILFAVVEALNMCNENRNDYFTIYIFRSRSVVGCVQSGNGRVGKDTWAHHRWRQPCYGVCHRACGRYGHRHNVGA